MLKQKKVPVVGVSGRQSACSQCRRSLVVVEASHLTPSPPQEKETVFEESEVEATPLVKMMNIVRGAAM